MSKGLKLEINMTQILPYKIYFFVAGYVGNSKKWLTHYDGLLSNEHFSGTGNINPVKNLSIFFRLIIKMI